jgi:hypothetical protein
MKDRNDDDLLIALEQALAPPSASDKADESGREGPSDAEVAALRQAVAKRFEKTESGRRTPVAPSGRARVVFWRRPAFALVAALVLTTTGTAVAVGAATGVPAPLRRIARAVGLPVESPAMVRAKAAVSQLRRALFERDAAGVRGGATELRARAAELEGNEVGTLGAEKDALLREADRFLEAVAKERSKRKVTRPKRTRGAEGDDSGNDEVGEDEERHAEEAGEEHGREHAPFFRDDEERHKEDEDDEGPPEYQRGPVEFKGPGPDRDNDDDDDDDNGGGGREEGNHDDDKDEGPKEGRREGRLRERLDLGEGDGEEEEEPPVIDL